MRLLWLSLLLAISTGCAHTAVVHCWEPAEIAVTGMNRIAVVDFTGENGQSLASTLSTRLWENQFYTIVDQSELTPHVQTASFDESPSLNEMLEAAKESDLDGIIVGSVIEYYCDDQLLGSTDALLASQEEPIEGLTVESQNNYLREGSVTIAFRLVDVETGEVHASKQVSKHFKSPVSNSDTNVPTRGEVLETLSNQCVAEIVEMLAPHQSSCEMKLAKCDFWVKGSGEVKRGLKQAKNGDWSAAEKSWESALEENQENHAALFNLAVVAAKRQEYDLAEQYALDALKIEHQDCYTDGLEKIRQRRTALERASDQRDSRVVQSSATLWQ